jgi:hypothetical protein
MASTRRTQALDVPEGELERMKQTLSPRYGSELWDPEGIRLLAVRVPRDEPDLVNDLESAVEYLAPGDVAAAAVTLFIGERRSHIVPTPTLKDLMAARVESDHAQAQRLRRELKPGEHKVFTAPADARRLPRLALRIGCASVADMDEPDLAPFTRAIGAHAREDPYSRVAAVHLIADRDDVRIDGDLFFQDLAERWADESERHRLAGALVGQQQTSPKATPAAGAPRERVAKAPLRGPDAVDWEAGPPEPSAPSTPGPAPEGMGEIFDLDGPGPQSTPASPAPAASGAASPVLVALEKRLRQLGFETRIHPAGAHAIDLAAERAEGFPQRLIAFAPERLDRALAERVLAAAKALGAEQALVVCPEADVEARQRFIATRAKWLAPTEIQSLAL